MRHLRRIDYWNWVFAAYGVLALWLKSIVLDGYIVNRPYISPDIRGGIGWIPSQTVYLCFAAIVIAPVFLFKKKGCSRYLLFVNVAWSALFLFDLWYFRAFMRFTSIHNLKQGSNLHNLSSAILSFIHPTDFLFLLDSFVLMLVLLFWKKRQLAVRSNVPAFFLIITFSSGFLFHFNATVDIEGRPLFYLRWAPIETITVLSPIGYHLYDAIEYWKEIRRIELTQSERAEIGAWFDKNREKAPPNAYQGLFRSNNLIILQCESLESFVIGKKINGQEITPALNRLIGNSLYFRNFMEQVGDGTSSDAEFMANTSVYPLRRGSVSWRYPQNRYNSLPKLLQKRGYWTLDIHPDPGSYWNWMSMMYGIGMNQCLDVKSFIFDEQVEIGLSDGSFLRQVAPVLAKLKQPFYVYMITLSNHGPYNLPGKYRELKLEKTLDESEIGGYLQSVHYMDKHIGILINNLNAAGLLDNTVLAFFGDHCGIHKFSLEDLSDLPESEQRWMENGSRVPFILYRKGAAAGVFDGIGGQIDMLPTIAYLMGVDENEYEKTVMGRNLLNTQKSFAVLWDGQYLSVEQDPAQKEHVLRGMTLADKIIQSDYFFSGMISSQ
jgi:lipoteichoic acid synthase